MYICTYRLQSADACRVYETTGYENEDKLRQRRMTSRNQQHHVTASESRRWRDVINRDFPRNVTDRRRR